MKTPSAAFEDIALKSEQRAPEIPHFRSCSSGWRRKSVQQALAAVLACMCGVMPLAAEEWTTVDVVEEGWQWGVASDRAGNVFVAGDVTENGVTRAVLSKSVDSGATWEDHVDSGVQWFGALATRSIEGAALGSTEDHLVVAGQSQSEGYAQPPGFWTIKRSLDAGATWEVVDTFRHPSWTPSRSSLPEISATAIDAQGNIYVAAIGLKSFIVGSGKKTTTESRYLWIVRKIARDGSSTTFDLEMTARGGYSWPKAITCVGTDVYVAGSSGDRWLVLCGRSAGATWTVVDDFRLDPNHPAGAEGITHDTSGNVYVVGGAQRPLSKTSSPSHWLVRKLASGASSFVPFGEPFLFSGLSTTAASVTTDIAGNVHVTGRGRETTGRNTSSGRWITRSMTSGGVFISQDVFSESATTSAMGTKICTDGSGNIFSGGVSGSSNWVVRRKLVPVVP